MSTDQTNAVVLQRIEVAPGLIILRVAPDEWELSEFVPGQFAVLGLPPSAPRCRACDPCEPDEESRPDKLIKRAYSIASASHWKQYMEFYITLVRSGALTPRLFALDVGDRLWLGQKFTGSFTLDPVPEGKRVILMATGTGLAPYMSMMRTLLHDQSHEYVVIHGARHSWDLGYRSELSTMDRLSDKFIYIPSITRPAEETVPWTGLTGYLQNLWQDGSFAEIIGARPTPDDTHIFLCGNPSMIEAIMGILEGEGFTEHKRRSPGTIHVEKYW